MKMTPRSLEALAGRFRLMLVISLASCVTPTIVEGNSKIRARHLAPSSTIEAAITQAFSDISCQGIDTDVTTINHGVPLDGNDEPPIGTSIDDWIYDHNGSSLVELTTHGAGSPSALCEVELYTSFEDSEDRFERLVNHHGWDEDHLAIFVGPNPNGWFAVGLMASGMRDSPKFNASLASPATAILGWCSSTGFKDNYVARNASAVFYTSQNCDPDGNTLGILNVLNKLYWSNPQGGQSYNNTAGEADRYLTNAYGANKVYALYTTDNGRENRPCVDCSVADPHFTKFGKTGESIYWWVDEDTLAEYVVLGFSEKKRMPDTAINVNGNPEGGLGRSVYYEVSTAASYKYWEVVSPSLDGSPQWKRTGFIEESDPPSALSEWRRHPVVISPGEATSRLPVLPTLSGVYLSEAGGWVAAPDSVMVGLRDLSLKSGGGRLWGGEECISCTPSTGSDSTYCADFVYHGHVSSIAWMFSGGTIQQQYLPGRILVAWSGQPGPSWVPASSAHVRSVLRLVICRNRAWNSYAETHGLSRRFPEAPMLVMVGSPGYKVSGGELVTESVYVGYDVVAEDDGICDTGCTVDGYMASPWDTCPERIAVPYTRIPAETQDEVERAFVAALEYSGGQFVDEQKRVALWAGDRADNGGSNLCYLSTPLGLQPVECLSNWANIFSPPKHPMVRTSFGCTTAAQMARNQLNSPNGAALILGLGHYSTAHWTPGAGGLYPASDFARQQRLVAILPSCHTTSMIGWDTNIPKWPALRNVLFNEPEKTQFAFSTGFSTRTYYGENQALFGHIVTELDRSRSTETTWQEVVFRAQLLMSEETGRWKMLQRVSNIGAPAMAPRDVTTVVLEQEGVGERTPYINASPNPSSGTGPVKINFQLASRGRAAVRVFDVMGRLVSVLLDETVGPEIQTVMWDGKDATANTVRSGFYFIRVDFNGTHVARKVLRIK